MDFYDFYSILLSAATIDVFTDHSYTVNTTGYIEENADTDFFIFHQANKLINESVRKKLKITDISKVLYSLEKFGNTSSASIPLTMITEAAARLSSVKNNLCLCGFGVGFSWGSALIKTNPIVCLPLIEKQKSNWA